LTIDQACGVELDAVLAVLLLYCDVVETSWRQTCRRTPPGASRAWFERRPALTGSAWSQRLDQAAVDHEVRARDISRAITGQEEHQIGDFVGTGESSCYEASL
jgi:hypothetical protein